MSAVASWARSGAMTLSGTPGRAPLMAPGDPAGFVERHLAALSIDRPGLLGERATWTGRSRRAPWSVGGAFTTLAAGDGWVGLSLARPSDRELVPALVEEAVPEDVDPWPVVQRWLGQVTAREASERLEMLSLPGGEVAGQLPSRAGVELLQCGGRRTVTDAPLVVDLTSLWAGPLAARLLRGTGARVVKVESRTRPDGARRGTPGFFDELHAGSEFLSLDLVADRDQLLDLMGRADLVLEASRPRALRRLGYVAEEVVAAGTSWLSVTGYGRASDRVGFGDDVAACAGLVRYDDTGRPVPIGDAIADPLTGVAAARAAVELLAADRACLVDVSMAHVCAGVVGPVPEHAVFRRADRWWVDDGADVFEVRSPYRATR